jgi:hypothetical protein
VTAKVEVPQPQAEGDPAPASGTPRNAGAQDAPPPAGKPAQGAEPLPTIVDSPIAYVDGEAVLVSELLSSWLHLKSLEAQELYWTILDSHIAAVEARQLGIALDDAAVEKATSQIRSRLEAKLNEQEEGLTLENYVGGRLMLDPDRYVEVLEDRQRRMMLMERVVRTRMLVEENAVVRLIIVTTKERADEVEAALAAGRPFAEVATELSEDETRRVGGELPPMVRLEGNLLSQLAFATQEGGVTGPIEDSGRFLWVHVEEFRDPLEGPWAVIEPAVEQSLARRPVGEYEFVWWRRLVSKRHDIDIRPFYRLAGEPTEGM